jgi:hypothetical protein
MPGTGRNVTVRATSVKGSVFGDAAITLQPLPSSCLVTSNGGALTGPTQLTLGNSLQLAATINPPDAPQSVFWTIDWNGVGQGSGNPTVGTVSVTGLYTSPTNLPTPSQVFVRARSQVASSVTDDYQIDLVAPPPTSFTVVPSSVTLTAGGAGVDFDATSFVPSNANRSVTWAMNPVFGSLDSQTGVYTPPQNSSTTTVVSITATSTVAATVTASASVTVQPNAQVAPQTLTISPNNGRTFVSGRALQFTASVLPSGAQQTVTWAMVSGLGTINASGVYSPPVTLAQLDSTCVIRCTSTVDSGVFDSVTIDLDGAGDPTTLSNSNTPMGRSEPVAFYDAAFDRVIYCGGLSEGDTNKHDDAAFMHDLTNNVWKYVGRMNPTQAANTIAWAHDSTNRFVYAIVGNNGGAVGVYRLNLALSVPSWSSVTAPGSDVPVLSSNFRYLAMYDPISHEIYISVSSSNTIYRLDVNTPGSLSWKTKKTGVTGGLAGTPLTEKCAYLYDTTRSQHVLIGTGALSSTKCWALDDSGGGWSWNSVNLSGPGPSSGYDDGSASFDGAQGWVFGGKAGGGAFSNSFWSLDMTSTPYVWTSHPIAIGIRGPQARGRCAMLALGAEVSVYGGKNSVGMFGDLWHYEVGTATWYQPAPDDMLPQGRKFAAATWVDTLGAGWVYGGVCDFGISDEMWRIEYSTSKSAWTWFLEGPSGFSTSIPSPLHSSTLNWDPTGDRLLLFAGGGLSSGSTTYSNKLYAYDVSTRVWSQPAQFGGPPPGRLGHTSAYNSAAKELIYFGGQDGAASYRNDVWMYNVQINAWTQPSISGTIEGRVGAFAGFQPSDNNMFVLGGATLTSGGVLQLYQLHFTSLYVGVWSAIATHQFGAPKGVFPGAGSFDLAGERFLCAPPGQYDNQALVFCHQVQGANPPPTWQTQNIGSLTHGIGAVGMYDSVNGRFIAYGGENDIGGGKFRKLNQVRVVRLK